MDSAFRLLLLATLWFENTMNQWKHTTVGAGRLELMARRSRAPRWYDTRNVSPTHLKVVMSSNMANITYT